jgi:tetratricopeptide (TPR) repeat protein
MVKELLDRIEKLRALELNQEIIEEIISLYDSVCDVTLHNELDLSPILDYITFLCDDLGRFEDAFEAFESIDKCLRQTGREVSAREKSELFYLNGKINIGIKSYNHAIVVLDDAYQHRSLHPDLNILLIDYNRLTYQDEMLPLGELREPSSNTDRADIIIFTKCPNTLMPVDMLSTRTQIRPFPYQTLYYTTLTYSDPKGLFTNKKLDLCGKEIILVTGIAQPQHLHKHLEKYASLITALKYPDHHKFTTHDIKEIEHDFEKLNASNRAIITTEKDAARLISMNIPENIKNEIYTIGIEIEFLFDTKKDFDSQINKFLRNQNLI